MYKSNDVNTWNEYLETTSRGGAPVKLDRILKRRMKAFLRARRLDSNVDIMQIK